MVKNPFHRYQNLLKEYIHPGAISVLWNNWNDHRRAYHNIHHLDRVLKEIESWSYRFSKDEFTQLVLAAFFHDAIYDPRNPEGNEDKSISFFRKVYVGKDMRYDLVDKAIECTKYRKRPTSFPLKVFWEADNAGFRDRWEDFLKYEDAIRKEYSFVPIEEYKKARIEFLQKNLGLFGPKGDSNVNKLIEHLRNI
jgi:predicted metal-dependent HD superfamily phosphohydrolase